MRRAECLFWWGLIVVGGSWTVGHWIVQHGWQAAGRLCLALVTIVVALLAISEMGGPRGGGWRHGC
jgi:hypothetical protein